MPKTYFVTGGAGFIGSCFILQRIAAGDRIVNLDKLTYSGNLHNLKEILHNPNHIFVNGDIANEQLVTSLLKKYQPNAVVNFAAETHVDRSILTPNLFVRTNVMGTEALLRKVKEWWEIQDASLNQSFRFHHISTDEVFGSLGLDDRSFTELTAYAPNSPYSASKASSDHFVRAYHQTYGLPTLITNCSNNYGPRQFPEKLIPLVILNAISGKDLPIYGEGLNIRDWLYVEDHCLAIQKVLEAGKVGETYNIGGESERTNLELVKSLCGILDEFRPRRDGKSYLDQITFVKDRAGHDLRYSIDCRKIRRELGWSPQCSLEEGLRKTVRWYLDNPEWIRQVLNGEYRKWMEINYKGRETWRTGKA